MTNKCGQIIIQIQMQLRTTAYMRFRFAPPESPKATPHTRRRCGKYYSGKVLLEKQVSTITWQPPQYFPQHGLCGSRWKR